jgi:hypothetical protein
MPKPLEVKRIIIFGDNDASYTGQAAAYALARRLGSEGFVVEVQVPAEPEADWNDVHRLRRSRSETPVLTETRRLSVPSRMPWYLGA